MILLNGYNLTINHFPNGELNILNIEEAIKLRKHHKKNHFVLKYESDNDLMALLFAKKQVDVRGEEGSELSIAYMPYSRMDRAETNETPFMLKFVCQFINDLNFDEVYVHEPHSDVTVQLLNNVVAVYDNVDFIKEVILREKFDIENDFIVFPDMGAMKRYDGLITSENTIYGAKKRDFATGEIIGLELHGNLMNIKKNPTAIIVDDLSSYGGTFVRTSKELRKLGFERVILLVCHAENSIFKGELFSHVDRVYTTDSMLTEHHNWENQKYRPQLKVYGIVEYMKEGVYK